VDNTWVVTDKQESGGKGSVVKLKVILTVAMIALSILGVLLLHNVGSSPSLIQSEGILVDFGSNQTVWTDANYEEVGTDPVELLAYASTSIGFTYEMSGGNIQRIVYDDGVHGEIVYENNAERTWGLWCIEKGGTDYVKMDSPEIDASDYKITTWAFMSESDTPTIALDATGMNIYGYSSPKSIITLSPVATETLCSIKGAVTSIVGTDLYSDYPAAVKQGHEDRTISIVGSYTDPSYESIMSLNPDMVICDGSQRSHVKMAESLRNSGVNALVIYECKDMSTILDNVFIVGSAIGSGMRATESMNTLSAAMTQIVNAVTEGSSDSVMVPLGRDAAPYVAGSDTYINDILEKLGDDNIFSDMPGWPQPVSEYIVERNPGCIIVLDADGYTPDEYDLFLSVLSEEWKDTDAYKNGNIYLLCEEMGNLAQRSAPRAFQLMEIVAMILHPDDFTGGSSLPKAIGNDYSSYLTITKDLGV